MKNNILIFSLIIYWLLNIVVAQTESKYEKLINDIQFENFAKKRKLVSHWQIYQLRDSGALVVRLKSNKKVIALLQKNNNTVEAKKIEKETLQKNKTILDAFMQYYTFSKVYFIYDYSSDSLRKNSSGKFFLNKNLERDTGIILKEKFYLIAENDNLVTSTIGMIPDSLAPYAVEKGSESKNMAIVIKNKYGHQLKAPFPFFVRNFYVSKKDMFQKLPRYASKSQYIQQLTLPTAEELKSCKFCFSVLVLDMYLYEYKEAVSRPEIIEDIKHYLY